MQKLTTTRLRWGLGAFGAFPYYLLFCAVKEPRRTINFLKNVYDFQQEEKIQAQGWSGIPTVQPMQLFPALFEKSVQLLDLGGNRPSGTTLLESYLLACIVRLLGARTLFEFGTFEGRTTLQLALNSPEDATVYTLDLPENGSATRYPLSFPREGRARTLAVGGLFQPHPQSRKIKQLYSDSATADYETLRGKVDFVFIDGDHGYDYVKSDSENAFSMVSPNGVILWHDYGSRWRDVARYLREVARHGKKKLYHLEGTTLAIHGPSI